MSSNSELENNENNKAPSPLDEGAISKEASQEDSSATPQNDNKEPSPWEEANTAPAVTDEGRKLPAEEGDCHVANAPRNDTIEEAEPPSPLPSPWEEANTAQAVTDEGRKSPAEATETAAEEEAPLISQPTVDSFPPRGSQEQGEDSSAMPQNDNKEPSPQGKGDRLSAVDEAQTTAELQTTIEAQTAAGKKKTSPSSIVFVVLSSVLFLTAVFIFVTSVVAKINGKQPEFFGYSFSIVLTDSMTPEIKVGELVVVHSCDISEVAEAYNEDGEKLNIVFISRSGTLEGERIVHKVYSVNVDENGEIYIQTKGEKEGAPVDSEYVRSDNFVGVAVYHSAVLGTIVSFLSNARNWVIIAVLAVLLVFSYKQVKKIIKYAKEEKKEEK